MNTLKRTALIVRLAINARRAKLRPNTTSIVGLAGRAQTAIGHQGTVFVRGELWPAQSRVNVAPGEMVRVTGMKGLALEVDPFEHGV